LDQCGFRAYQDRSGRFLGAGRAGAFYVLVSWEVGSAPKLAKFDSNAL